MQSALFDLGYALDHVVDQVIEKIWRGRLIFGIGRLIAHGLIFTGGEATLRPDLPELIRHGADLGLRVRADDLPALFAEAACGLFSMIADDLGTIRPVEELRFSVPGDVTDELLHDWLAELWTDQSTFMPIVRLSVNPVCTPPASSTTYSLYRSFAPLTLITGKSTLNRLELTAVGVDEGSRYKKIVAHCRRIDRLLVDLFLQAHASHPPSQIVLDVDATDDPVHGEQLGRFFHGYYEEYCYLPLYVMCGPFVLAAKLRAANIDASAGALKVLQRIVAQIRQTWPNVRIIIRGDSGFCREPIMAWCEQNRVDYLFGLAKNRRLLKMIGRELHEAELACKATGKPARLFAELEYQTRKSWSRRRRVVAKAEHLDDKTNPRFVVSSITPQEIAAQALYEEHYCGRGDMENRIKEQQLCLFADRTSAATMRANQIRLYFSTIAYTLILMLRTLGLEGTELKQAQPSTIRQRLLKIGAQVRVTVRKVWVALSSAFVLQEVFALAYERLAKLPAWAKARPLLTTVCTGVLLTGGFYGEENWRGKRSARLRRGTCWSIMCTC